MTNNCSEKWATLVTLRPEKYGRLTISDPVRQKRATVASSALIKMLAAQFRNTVPAGEGAALADSLAALQWSPASGEDPVKLERYAHWHKRGWETSLRYFLWSRNRSQLDGADFTGDVRRQVVDGYLAEGQLPPQYTEGRPLIILPTVVSIPNYQSLGQLLMHRRTTRTYAGTAVDLSVLGTILYHTCSGIRERLQAKDDSAISYLRSFGVSLKFYVIGFNVRSLEPGVYLYRVDKHALELIAEGCFRKETSSMLVGMSSPETANWTIVITANFADYQWRYRHERALRNLYTMSGRIGQRLILFAQAFGLGTVPTPAIKDDECSALLRIFPETEGCLYTLTSGTISQQPRSI